MSNTMSTIKFRKPLAGLVFSLAIGASIATSKAYPEWSAEAETEAMSLVDFEQPHIVGLQASGELGEGVGYYGTQLQVQAWASVLAVDSSPEEDEIEDTGDTGEDTGGDDPAELEPLTLQLELSSDSIGEEPLLIDLAAYSKKGQEPAHIGTAFVLPCEDPDLGSCADEVQVQLVLSRPLAEDESIDGEIQFKGLASGPVYGEEAAFPEIELSLSVEQALE